MIKESYRPVIGLEIHIELNTKSKMFCGCVNDADERHPDVNVCPICMGHPGTLPVINEAAVRKVIKTGLALNCEIPELSKFDRKNYFYPDLPKGYQISQYDKPFCQGGFLMILGKKIGITRVHLEEDTGKLIHPEGADYNFDGKISSKEKYSLVDLNRAGIPLMELVTEPDLSSGVEARKFAEELQQILHYLGVSEANMEKGQMRIEVNISLGKGGKLGTKVEIKNLNSFRAVEKATEYEIERQAELLDKGEEIMQETRGWDDTKEVTVSQREKEEAHDYRYFPEPDLPPLNITPEMVNEIKSEIPELPQQRRDRFQNEYKLSDKEIEIFVQNKDLGEYYEKAMSELRNWVKEAELKKEVKDEEFFRLAKICSNYLITDLQGLLKSAKVSGEDFLITPENFAEFITLIYEDKISSKIAKMVLEEMFKKGADPSHIIEEKGLVQITDEAEIENIIKEVISKNPKVVQDFKSGKANAFQFLIGQIMAASKGKANPQIINKLLKENLTKTS